MRKPDVVIHLPFVRKPRRLPVVLSPEEVSRFLEAAPGLKYQVALTNICRPLLGFRMS